MPNADPSLSVAERVDAACDSFEREWRAGRNPRLEDYVAAAPESDRSALCPALAAIEAELTAGRGAGDTSVSRESVRTGSHHGPGPTVHRPADQSVIPQRVGRFEVRAVLGAGAFGRVYRAFDPSLDREVALKVPLAESLQTAADRDRFLKEARAAATVSHPNICQIHEVGEHDGQPYIVMALVPGQSLAEALRGRTEPLPEKQAAIIVRKLALALEAAHKKGVVHRDLKPANVMFDKERKDLVVMDFGLARRAVTADARDTQSGVVMGTPAYMSPEQARGEAKDVGPAGDVFSLGIMMYELLTGVRPFTGNAHEVIGRIILMEPEPPSARRPSVNPLLEAACMKALSKDPRQRFASMKQFAAAVDEYLRKPVSSTAETARAVETVPNAEPIPDTDDGLSINTRKLAEVFEVMSVQRKIAKAETAEEVEEAAERAAYRAAAKSRTPRWVWAAVATVALAFIGLSAFAIHALTKKSGTAVHNTNNTSVRVVLNLKSVDLSDASLKFALDGEPITADALAKEIELTVGDHELVASRGGTVVKRVRFTVSAGPTPKVDGEKPLMTEPVAPKPKEQPVGPKPPALPLGPSDGWNGMEVVSALPHKSGLAGAVFAPGGKVLTALHAESDNGDHVFTWDTNTGKVVGTPTRVTRLARVFAGNGKILLGLNASGGLPGDRQVEIVVWDMVKNDRATTFAFDGAPGRVSSLDVSHDGKSVLASRHLDAKHDTAILDLATGEYRMNRIDGFVSCFVPEKGKNATTALVGFKTELRQIEVATGKVTRTLNKHTGQILCVACAPDGRFAVTSDAANELVLWDLSAADGAPVVFGKSKAPISCLAFSPTGRSLLSGSTEGVLKLWDMGERKEVFAGRADERLVTSIVFSPDGTHALTAGWDGKAKLWKLTK